MNLDNSLLAAGVIAEAIAVIFLFSKRIYRTLPVFSFYVAWSILNDIGAYFLIQRFPGVGMRIYLTSTIIDSIFQFAVLVELSMSVLKPVRASLPRWTFFAVGIAIALICAVIWPFAEPAGFKLLDFDNRLIIHLQQTVAALRILFFLVLAALSQLLSLGWRDRELQVSTGWGFYSLASLSVSVLHAHQTLGSTALNAQYHILDQMVAASYLCSMAYWMFCFAQKVPERREFTPQMQNFLLAVAGSARSARMALNSDDNREPVDKL